MILGLPVHRFIISHGTALKRAVEGETPSAVTEIIGFESVVECVGQRREVVGV
jgi:4-hydroxy-L-threonine phosphate dehydrogenase PdxA